MNLVGLTFSKMKLFRVHRFYSVISKSKCWSCGQTGELQANLFCQKCRVLQKPNKQQNFFNLIGIKESYDIDEDVLTKKYKDLQKHLHPDKYSNKDKSEREISEEYSSLVNEAYKTLQQPLSRGIYMLKLKGKEISEKTQMDQEFLMEVMAKNEEIEEASSKDEILRLNSENKAVLEALKKNLSRAFFDGNLDDVIKIVTRMKYYTSIDAQIQSLIRSKGIIQ